jgi:hypothetical protein
LIAAGRIQKSPEGKIDRVQANAVLDAVRVKADGKRPGANAPPPDAAAPSGDGRKTADGASQAYTTARAVRETTAAKIEQLRYRERIGELAEVADVRRGVQDAFGPIVRELRNLPDKIAGRAAVAASDPRKFRDLLAAEIEGALAGIADVVAALPGSVGQTRQ